MRDYTDNERSAAVVLIKFYNLQAGTSFRYNNEKTQKHALEALDRVQGDLKLAKNIVRSYIAENAEDAKTDNGFVECFENIKPAATEEKPVEPAAVAEPAPAAMPTEQQIGGAMGLLEQAVVQLVAKMQAEKIEAAVMDSVEDKVRAFIKEEYGTIERKIITVVDGKRVPMAGVQHEKFETVIKFVANDIPVYLTGPAGSGKNVLCKQVAEALGLDFYFTNAVTQEYKLTGYTDALGNYQPTQFYKAFTEGGLFMLDEMDASIPEVLNILNAAIANRYFDFPAPIGYKEAHPDFRVIAAGNTFGQGADYQYVGRNQLDAASLDRFMPVKVGYSEAIENSVAGDMELANFCIAFRKAAQDAGQQVIVSYRGIGTIAKMMQVLPLDECLESCLVKGMEKDDLNIICNALPDSKYRRALKTIVSRL